MAFKTIGTVTTLASIKANAVLQAGAISQQESEILDFQLNDIIHRAIVFVRSMFGRLLDSFYQTSATVTEVAGKIDISTLDLADVNRFALYDSVSKKIPIVSNEIFYEIQTLYSPSDLAQAIFGRVANIMDTDNKLEIETFRGSQKSASVSGYSGVVTLTYPRNPKKVTTDTEYVDLPEHLVPLATDVATVAISRKLLRKPPEDVEARLTAQLNAAAAQIGLAITPAKN